MVQRCNVWTDNRQLKTKDIKRIRLELLEQQNNKCPLCGSELLEEDSALDHDHTSGLVRQVLHRSCNQAEGRIKSWINRSRFNGEHVEFLRNLVQYLETDYTQNPEHPTHRLGKIKKFRNKKKDEQIQILTEMNADVPDRATKEQLVAVFRKMV